MAERISGLQIDLTMNDTSVKRSLTAIKDSFRDVKRAAQVNMNNIRFDTKDVSTYKKNIDELSKSYNNQKKNVDDLKSSYDQLVATGQENTAEGQKLRTEYNKQVDELNRLGHALNNAENGLRDLYVEQSKFTKMGNAFKSIGSGLQGVGNAARDVGGTLTKYITLPIVGITSAAAGMTAAFGWERLVGLDSAQAQLKGLGYSTEEVGRISDQVTSAIEGGMTTMAEGTSIAAGALAAGVEEGAELERYIKLVGDAAVGANRPVGEMAMIFNRVQGSGKLMTQELNMVEEGMPGFSKAMADHLGVAPDKMREMVTAGEVSSDDFLTVMDGFAGGMASAYSNSWSGMVANTKAYIGIIGENLLSGVFQQSKESIAEFIEFLKSDEVVAWAERAGEAIGNAFTKIVDAVKGAIQWFIDLDSSQKKLIGAFAGLAVAAGPVLTVLGTMAIFMGNVFNAVGILLGPLAKLSGTIKMLGGILPALKVAFAAINWPITLTVTAVAALTAGFTIAYTKSETFRNIVNGLIERFKAFIPTILSFGQSIYTNFIGIAAPAIQAVRDFFIDMFQKVKQFWQSDGQSVIQAITNGVNIVRTIVSTVMPIITSIIGTAFKLALTIVRMVWENIKGVINGALNVIIGIVKVFTGIFTGDFSKMWEGVKQIFAGAIQIVWNTFQLMFYGRLIRGIGSLVKLFSGSVKTLWTNVVSFFKGMTDGAVKNVTNMRDGVINIWNTIMTGIGNILMGIVNIIRAGFSSAWNITRSIFTTMKNFLNTIWNGIRSIITTIAQAIVNRVQAIWNAFSGVTRSIFTGVRNFMTSLWNAVRTTVVNIVQALWNRVQSIWNVYAKVTRTIFNALRNFLSTVWNAIRNTVANVIQALWRRVNNIWNTFSRVTRNIFNTLRGWLTSLWSSVRTILTNTVQNLWNRVHSTWNTFGRVTRNIFNALRNWLSNIWNAIRNRITSVVNNLWNRVRNTFNRLRSGTKDIFNNVRNYLVDKWNNIKSSITGIAGKIWGSVKKTFNNMKNGLANIIDGIGDHIDGMVDAVKRGLNKLIDGVNWVAGKIGMDDIPKIKLSTGTTHDQTINRKVKTTGDGALKSGTLATVGDRGPGNGPGGYRRELIQFPNGKTALTPAKDTQVYLPKGSRVFNGKQTHAMKNGVKLSTGTLKGLWDGIASETGKRTAQVMNFGKKGIDKGKEVINKGKKVIGDIWDYATNPGKLVDKILSQFGVNFDFAKGDVLGGMMSAMYKKLKDGVKNLFTGWLEDSGGGDGSSFTKFRVTTPYSPNSPVPGYPKWANGGKHYGIDYATPSGTTLKAPNAGTVSKLSDKGGGIVAKLLSGKFTQFFMHLSKVLKTGQVSKGEAFAKTGNSGAWTTGPHLHYQVEKGNSPYVTNKNTVDPDKYLAGESGGGGGSKKASAWRPQVIQALKKVGLPTTKAYQDAWIKQIDTESGGDAGVTQSSAVRDINAITGNLAKGLVQVIPPTFNAYKLPGHGNIMNGLDNLIAGMNYAKSRYGKSGMLSRIGKGMGYETGGLLQREGFFYGAEGNKEEAVIPLHKPTEAMKLLAIVGKKLAGKGKSTSQLPNAPYVNNNSEKQDQIIELLAKQNQILMKLLGKESDIYMDSEKVGSILDERNAVNASLQF